MSDASTAMSGQGWGQASRWDLGLLWRVASMGPAKGRVPRAVAAWLRPPMVTVDGGVSVRVSAPMEARLRGAVAVVASVGLVAAVVASVPPVVGVVLCAVSFGPLVALASRLVEAWLVPAGHVYWADVRAASGRVRGDGERALGELSAVDGRPVVLEVNTSADGLVRMYERLGFVATGRERCRRDGRVLMEMSRPAVSTAVPCEPSATTAEVAVGASAALVMVALGLGPVVAVVAFVLLLAALSDWRVQRISNSLLASGGLVVLASVVAAGEGAGVVGGAAVAAGPLLVMNLVSGGRSPGMGDVKLAAFGGAAVGTVSVLVAGLVAVVGLFVGGVFGVVYQSVTNRRGFPLGVPLAAVFAVTVLVQAVNEGSLP